MPETPETKDTITGETFLKSEVELDGRTFVKCTFRGVALVFRGAKQFGMTGCYLDDCRWDFRDHAVTVVTALRFLYHGMGDDGALVEELFAGIRRPPQSAQPPTRVLTSVPKPIPQHDFLDSVDVDAGSYDERPPPGLEGLAWVPRADVERERRAHVDVDAVVALGTESPCGCEAEPHECGEDDPEIA